MTSFLALSKECCNPSQSGVSSRSWLCAAWSMCIESRMHVGMGHQHRVARAQEDAGINAEDFCSILPQ